MIESFDAGWSAALAGFLSDQRADALGSIVRERHRIAHGENSTISFARVSEYRKAIDEIVDFIADLADPIDD